MENETTVTDFDESRGAHAFFTYLSRMLRQVT